jgi:tetratricopeptide (TPR) repeat protein
MKIFSLKKNKIFTGVETLMVHRAFSYIFSPACEYSLICKPEKRFRSVVIPGIAVFMLITSMNAQQISTVKLTEVDESIPTYLANPPDPNPMFFFGQGSQGAEGRIYPYPAYNNLTNKKSDKIYHLVYLENEYVKIGILPEIGGRLFSAVDKTNNYNYIYTHKVVKPALIGLLGAWISGGIEWNIPHHHRASTFSPVQWSREERPDGSKTIWVGEFEPRQRMRWAVGYTLRPGSSVLECSVRIINGTPFANSMLCFANVAVPPNDKYQVIFPPSTQWSTGHSKRGFAPWPVADSVDQSMYKNHPNSGSFFAWNYTDDFVAGFDHGINAGIMAVADHNIVPGKKFFTWGVGSMWDKILADDGKPYLEIMVGAYSDNQPDYSWMQPFEERAFEMNWYPFRGTGGAKNANLDATVNLDIKDGKATFGFYTTKAYQNAIVRLTAGKQVIVTENITINPGKPYSKQVAIPAGVDEHDLRASVSADGKELVAYSPIRLQPSPMPAAVANALAPSNIQNNEELFLAGQRIDQFHNPTLDADPYYEELLKRDPGSVEGNTGMGLLDLKAARWKSAEQHLQRAIDRLTYQYTTARNAEPIYYLGLALKAQGKENEAYTAFYKATWSQEWKAPGYYSVAQIDASRGDFSSALNHIDRSLDANAYNSHAYGLKSSILRHLDRSKEALDVLTFALHKTDPLDVHLMAEQWLITKDSKIGATLFTTLNAFPMTAQEIATEYSNAGLYSDGASILQQSITAAASKSIINPMVYYYLGDFAEKLGETSKASEYRKQAVLQPVDYVFPFQYEAIPVLRRAIEADPKDARAPYYLGNLLFDWQPDEAIAQWEKAGTLDPGFPVVWRNLAQAYSHKAGDEPRSRAIAFMEKAVTTGNNYPTHFAELDRLYKSSGAPAEKRLALLEKNQKVVAKDDEVLGDLIGLKTFAGKSDEAIQLLMGRTFTIAEGANVFNTGQAWADAHLVHGIKLFGMKKYNEALADFLVALNPPENLRSQQGRNARQNQITFWTGCAYEALGQKDKAKRSWTEVVTPPNTRTNRPGGGGGRGFGNLNQGEQHYFVAMAQKKLGLGDKGEAVFRELAATNTNASSSQTDNASDPQFVSARRLPSLDELAIPHFNAGLGYAGLGNKTKAHEEFNAALAVSPDFLSAKIALDLL